jgi:hypothetical protein
MFDMNQCKPGDKLVCRDGDVVIYKCKEFDDKYPHKIIWDGGQGSRTDKGSCFSSNSPSDRDIISFYKEPKYTWKKMTQSEVMSLKVNDKIKVNGVETEVVRLYNRDNDDYGFDTSCSVVTVDFCDSSESIDTVSSSAVTEYFTHNTYEKLIETTQENDDMTKVLSKEMKAGDLVTINCDVSLAEFLFLRAILGKQTVFQNLFLVLDSQLINSIGASHYYWDIAPSLKEQKIFDSYAVKNEINEFINTYFTKEENKEHKALMEQIAKHEASLAELKAKAEAMGKS